MKQKQFVIMKKVAKHGRQTVIVIPAMLKDQLRPGTLLQLRMDMIAEGRG
ncbi:MAG: hypothetical protein ABH864_06945 [archaeon]